MNEKNATFGNYWGGGPGPTGPNSCYGPDKFVELKETFCQVEKKILTNTQYLPIKQGRRGRGGADHGPP